MAKKRRGRPKLPRNADGVPQRDLRQLRRTLMVVDLYQQARDGTRSRRDAIKETIKRFKATDLGRDMRLSSREVDRILAQNTKKEYWVLKPDRCERVTNEIKIARLTRHPEKAYFALRSEAKHRR
jgi:hypothetical protein